MMSAVMLMALVSGAPRAMVDTSSAAIGVDAIHQLVEERAEGWSNHDIRTIAEAIYRAASEAHIDPRLVLGIIHAESSFKRGQISSVGARGLLQLMPSTAAAFAERAGIDWRGPQTLHDPVANVEIGVAYLSFLLARFGGNVDLALAAYCHGPYKVLKTLRSEGRLDRETRSYSRKVRRTWARFKLRTESIAVHGALVLWQPHGPPRRMTDGSGSTPLLAQIRAAVTSMQTNVLTPDS